MILEGASIPIPDPAAPVLMSRREGPIAWLTLNRPDRRNALSLDLLRRLEQELIDLEQDRRVRLIVLGATGPVFSAGHDLGEMREHFGSESALNELFATCSRVMLQVRRQPQPVIARVQGLATAAGCQLVATCDLAIAAEEASFATPGVKIGLFCTTPMIPLVRAIPGKAALEMLLTGEPISAERAFQLGLVNRVVPAARLDASIDELARAILKNSPAAIRLGKGVFQEFLGLDEAEAYARGVEVMTANARDADAREGINAFLEKRPPSWPGP